MQQRRWHATKTALASSRLKPIVGIHPPLLAPHMVWVDGGNRGYFSRGCVARPSRRCSLAAILTTLNYSIKWHPPIGL